MSVYNFFKLEKLSRAMWVYPAMKPVFCLCKCFGLVQFSRRFRGGVFYNELNLPLLIYNALLLILADTVYLVNVMIWMKDSLHSVMIFSVIVQAVFSVICNIVAFYISLVKASSSVGILNALNGLHRLLKHPTSTFSDIRRNLIFLIVLLMSWNTVSLVVSWHSIGADIYLVHLYGSFFINEACNTAMEIQYLGFLQILRRHFAEVNSMLKTFNRLTKRAVVATMKYHDRLCDIVDAVNSTYSLFVLLIVTKTFVTVSCTLFIVLSSQYGRELQDFVGVLNGKNQVAPWCALCIAKLLLLVKYCSSTVQEANQTAIFVHKLAARTNNRDVKEELDRFSLQLIHRRIVLTAYGFFAIDFTLLYSIVGAVTTYLVVLIQFQLTSECSSQTNSSLVI